ncbi:hypothetical protein BDY19DRAFT_922258 [Irpex rosettiformis]|uniref:Uncharacterized protein n=1 Tax=Irpex rosettiformis TaxID=378272 RepID=A0ACB8UFT3_9APHY|nr:hypothetical protein BDY19DRAFT_922258 [Irpex rosettiformis]
MPISCSLSSTLMATKANPLPLGETLRDLALLRSCDIDLSTLLSANKSTTTLAADQSEVDGTVERSYEFVREARAALKILNRDEVEKQGGRVEDIRSTLDDVEQGLDTARSTSNP